MVQNRFLRIALILGFSFFLVCSGVYSSCAEIGEADFLASGEKYEAQDADNLSGDKQRRATVTAGVLAAPLLAGVRFSPGPCPEPAPPGGPIFSILRR